MAEDSDKKGGRGPVISRGIWMPLIVVLLAWAVIRRQRAKKRKKRKLDRMEGDG